MYMALSGFVDGKGRNNAIYIFITLTEKMIEVNYINAFENSKIGTLPTDSWKS